MRTLARWAAVAPWILLPLNVSASPDAGSKKVRHGADFSWHGRVPAGRTIELHGINGHVRAEWTSGSEVEVHAEKYGRRSDPDEVRIEVIHHDDGVTICALYPSPKGRPPNECSPHSSHSETRDNDVSVDFDVKVPTGVRFAGHTVNGDVEARSLRGDVQAATVNGSVEVSTSGEARANTVNGSISASLGKTRGREPLEFQTVNGTITLRLPRDAGADLRAETVNGEISTDFPITMSAGRISKQRMRGTIGSGGRELRLSTVNGSIRLISAD